MICNYIYSDLHFFGTNGHCNYCIELWLTSGISLWNYYDILDVGTKYGLHRKIYRYLWVVFLMLWTLLGLECDINRYIRSSLIFDSFPQPKMLCHHSLPPERSLAEQGGKPKIFYPSFLYLSFSCNTWHHTLDHSQPVHITLGIYEQSSKDE